MRLTLGRLMILVAFLGFMAWFIRPGWVVVFGSIDRRMLIIAAIALLPLKVAGVIWAARVLIKGRAILAGEELWVASAAIYLVGGCLLPSSTSHGNGWEDMAVLLFADLLGVAFIARFGRRPGPGDPSWAHYAGWLSAGSDALLFGLFARAELLY